jgi:hypothetical protein
MKAVINSVELINELLIEMDEILNTIRWSYWTEDDLRLALEKLCDEIDHFIINYKNEKE